MNLKKFFLEPSQTMEFLEVLIELIKMQIFLPQKLVKLITIWREICEAKEISINIKNLMRLLAKLGVTVQAILPAKIQQSSKTAIKPGSTE